MENRVLSEKYLDASDFEGIDEDIRLDWRRVEGRKECQYMCLQFARLEKME